MVVAFPVDETKRKRLSEEVGLPCPPIYTGSRIMPCEDCGELLHVGPRSQEAVHLGLPLRCPTCMIPVAARRGTKIMDLGNPEFGHPDLPTAETSRNLDRK